MDFVSEKTLKDIIDYALPMLEKSLLDNIVPVLIKELDTLLEGREINFEISNPLIGVKNPITIKTTIGAKK